MSEEELGKIAYEARAYQQQGEIVEQQMVALEKSANDTLVSIETLKRLEEAKKKTLIPIGSGVFIYAEKIDQSKVLVNVGANIIVEKTAGEAVEILEKRLKEIRSAQERMQRGLETISARLQELDEKARRIMAEMNKDVRIPKK